MIDLFNAAIGRIADAALFLFRRSNPWVGMTVVSLVTALLMLAVYRVASDQEGIRAAKDKIIAYLLEARLFRNDLHVSLRAQGNILRFNLKYLALSARPLVVMIVPLVLAMVQLDQWFGHEALRPGEPALVKVRLKEGHQPSREAISITPARGFTVETPPLRIDREGEADWRIRGAEPGNWDAHVIVDGESVGKGIVVGDGSLSRISPARVAPHWLDQLANPGEWSLPDSAPVKSIEITYPGRTLGFFGWRIHWLVAFIGLSILFGFLIKPWLGVEI
jgi:hypothetical protein